MEVRIFFIIQHTVDRQHCKWYDERIENEKKRKKEKRTQNAFLTFFTKIGFQTPASPFICGISVDMLMVPTTRRQVREWNLPFRSIYCHVLLMKAFHYWFFGKIESQTTIKFVLCAVLLGTGTKVNGVSNCLKEAILPVNAMSISSLPLRTLYLVHFLSGSPIVLVVARRRMKVEWYKKRILIPSWSLPPLFRLAFVLRRVHFTFSTYILCAGIARGRRVRYQFLSPVATLARWC